MNYFCPLLVLLLFFSKSSRCRADCSDDNRIPCSVCSKKNGGVGAHKYVERLMLEQTDTVFGSDSSYLYKLGGVFYDEDQKLTVSLVASSKDGDVEAKKSLKRVHQNGDDLGNAVGSIVDKDTAHIPLSIVDKDTAHIPLSIGVDKDTAHFPLQSINADVFKKILLEALGPTVILSQINDRKAERLLRHAQKKAERDAKKNGALPPSSETMDAEIRKAILDLLSL